MARYPRPIRAWRLPETAPVPTGQAATLEAALDRELVRRLGAVPLVLPIMEQLGLRDRINQRVHPEGEQRGGVDLGCVAEVLVLNRLLAPQPLVRVETWLADTVVPDLLGVRADQCNDDRLARALDALHPHLDALWQDLIVGAIQAFDVDLARLGYDITSIAFCGEYEQADLVTYGYSRDHRPDRQQVELATTTTIAGGVPLNYHVLAGNVADRTTPVANLRRLQGLLAQLPPREPAAGTIRPLVISDRAMLTREALVAYAASDLRYLGPLDPSVGDGAVRTLLESVSAAELAARPLAYRPQRAADDPKWEPYHGVLRELILPPPQPDQPPLQVRALVVWSPGKARLDAQQRSTYLTRLEKALQELAGKLGRRPYTTPAAVEKRVATVLRHHPARRFLTVQVEYDAQGLRLTWQRDETQLTAAAATDGRYVLGTNAAELDANTMLTEAKRRDVPEKGYATLKGPLAVRPIYLHKQERILGVIFCTMVALLVYALLELMVRRAGFPLTGRALLAHGAPLAIVVLVCTDGTTLRRITGLAPPLATILDALGWSPLDRYLTVHA
jgi:transposase